MILKALSKHSKHTFIKWIITNPTRKRRTINFPLFITFIWIGFYWGKEYRCIVNCWEIYAIGKTYSTLYVSNFYSKYHVYVQKETTYLIQNWKTMKLWWIYEISKRKRESNTYLNEIVSSFKKKTTTTLACSF